MLELELLTKTPITNADLRKAIEICISECFPAMDIANAIAGAQTTEWKILRSFTARQLFDEAKTRGLPLESFIGAVGDRPITMSPMYQTWLLGRKSDV
jgi:hypothetical protein